MTELTTERVLVPAPRTSERPRRGTVVGLVTAAMFVDAVFFALIAPLLPDYSEQLGLSKLEVGLLFAAHPAGTLLFAPVAAVLVRRVGTRATMTTGLMALGAATIVFGFAASLGVLAFCRFVQGASAALVWCGGLARLRDVAPPERRGAALGLAGSAAGAGSLFGPGFAALSVLLSTEVVLLALGLAALVLCAALHSAGELPGERHVTSELEPEPAAGGRLAGVARPLAVIVICGVVFGAVTTLAPLRLADLGVGVAGIAAVFALAAVMEIVVSPLAGHASDVVGRIPPIRLSLALAMPLLVLQAVAGSAWALGAAVALTTAVAASLWPLGTALLADESGERSGSPAGVFAASVVAWSAGLAGGSLLCGALAEHLGEGAAYGVLVAACALALLSLAAVPGRRIAALR
jgi:MFS transporter, DHA1 family, solute carrier family 18 (vesicular amine transporter), member 1/2